MHPVTYTPIGILHSEFTDMVGVPIQSALSKHRGTIEIFPEYADGLKDIAGFSHLLLLYHLHLMKGHSLRVVPFLDDKEHGIFATRSPKRPNPIGLSVVELKSVKDRLLHVSGMDIVDGTPLLDIKPYVRRFDAWDTEREGWFTDKLRDLKARVADDRFCCST